ncbi:MAG: hypothetical protein RL088_1655 [Verrucomicrobiota bacterium]
MKSSPNRLIEALESRIAPARVIIAGIPNSLGQPDFDFTDTDPLSPFINTETTPLDPISGAVGGGLPGVADTFYLRLSAGDRLQLFRTTSGSSVEDFITVQSGNIVVFFIDKEDSNGVRNNEVNEQDIVGIAAGNNAKFELKGALSGDIVYNLDEQGTPSLADDTLIMGGAMKAGQNIPGFTVGSSVGATIDNAGTPERVGGKVLASGKISNVVISGDVGAILAGSAGNGETFDFFPRYIGAGGLVTDTPGGNGVFNFAPGSGKAGSPVQNIIVDSITDRIEAGIGGEGAAGGGITKVFVRGDSDGFLVKAGDGGTTSPLKKNGGKGGSISNITIAGADDFTANDQVVFRAGQGGTATVGNGGAGGSVNDVFVGYTVFNGKRILSNGILRDDIQIFGGAGGDGKNGGKGGNLGALDILASVPEAGGDEISAVAGAGGDAVIPTGGKAGAGGSVANSAFRNVEASIGADIGVRAGDGGSAVGNAVGGIGGSVSAVKILGRQIQVDAGDGTDGKTGGKGGALASITIESRDGVVSDAIVLNAGIGGDGNAGNGGAGGNIASISIPKSDVNVLEFNSGIKGNGGDSVNGRGGAGGSVKSITVLDTDINATGGGLNVMNIRSGAGGDGDKGGGNGGELSVFSIVGLNIEPTVLAGDGGSALVKGKGGVGGAISNLEVAIDGAVTKIVGGVPTSVNASTRIVAGIGGNGIGTGGSGGAGGTIQNVSVNTPGFGSLAAGDGGSGPGVNAAAGKGGSILYAGVFAGVGTGELIAGDGGLIGSRPGAGGSIAGSPDKLAGLFAQQSLTIRAGNGSAGGAGGSISNLGYGSTSATLVPTPNGDILVRAGDGSASPDGKYVGRGGSITNVGGAVNNTNGDTVVRAGDGGGALKKGANGGSITGLALQRGGSVGVEFTIRAGDGGDAPQGVSGSKGGSVSGVNVVDIATEAVFRHIAAGNGGDALSKGGAGGSVSGVNVLGHDIGVRDGQVYGFTTMGGVFSGAGGAGAKLGVNGAVTNINADVIATIAAGRGATPQLASKVENIYVNASNLLKDSTGAFLPGLPGSEQVFRFGGFSLTATESLPGNATTGEIQTLDLTNIRLLPAGTFFTLTYGGDQTAALASTATTAEIQTALNALPSVQATGPGNTGTVTLSGVDPVVDVTFNIVGDQPTLISGEVDAQETAPLPLGATPAQVQTELNLLPFVTAAGGVVVTASLPSGYQITFNNPGNQSQIVGQEVFDVAASDLQIGIGLTPLTVTEVTTPPGNETHTFRPIAPFKFSITYTEGVEVHTTAQISATATASEVQAALEALPTIDPGDITVTKRVSPTSPDGTFDVKFNDLINHPTLAVTMFADELTVNEAFPGAFENISRETQIIRVDPMGDGQITFAFGVDSFAFNLPSAFTAAQLQNQFNLQPSIIAQGGVTVTLLAANTYKVVFGKSGDQPSINVQEDSFPLGYADVVTNGGGTSEVVRFTHIPGSPVRFGYNGKMSAMITPVGAGGALTSAQIKSALESIPDIGVGGISGVPTAQPDNTWRITFAGNTDRTTLNVGQRTTINGDLQYRGVSTTLIAGTIGPDVNERQLIRADSTGFFSLSFAGLTSGYLPNDATVTQVQTAVDSLIGPGGLTATVSAGALPNSFVVDFTAPGPVAQFQVEGLNIVQNVGETIKGAETLEQREVQVVEFDGLGEFAFHAPIALTAEEFQKGGEFTKEKQVLGMASVQALAGSDFTLTFQGQTTPVLPSNATAAQIQTALNALPSITAAGNVTVVAQSGGLLEISFNTFGDKTGVISGTVRGGASTPLLPGTASTTDIANALNALAPIVAVGGVTVENPTPGEFNVIFNQPGQMPTIQAFYQVRETQEIDFYSAGEFTISFGVNPGDVTLPIPAGASPAAVQSALNALPGIQSVGGVTVADGVNSHYTVTFNSAGDVAALAGKQTIPLTNSTVTEGTAVLAEIQKIVKPRRFVFDPTEITNGNYVGAFSDSTEINARVFKWIDANSNGLYEINEVPIDGLVAAKVYNQATVNFTGEARIVGGEFSFVESIKGSATDQEVQLLTIKADKYTLSFGGLQTAPLSGRATILAIQNALNALPTIQATGPGGSNGSVTVTPDVLPNTFAVTFNTPGDRAPITAPFFYDYNNIF